MNFIHSIKFRFTLWYLAILAILLVLLAGGLYSQLSRTLHTNFDQSLLNRAQQMAKFRDIIAIVAGGKFEEELGELVLFYYYENDQLKHVSQRKFDLSIDPALIDRAIAGTGSFTTIRTEKNSSLRILVTPFTPEDPNIKPHLFPPPPSFRQNDRGDRSEWHDRINSRSPIVIHQAAMVIGRPINDIEEALTQLRYILLLALPLTLVLAGGGGVFLARRALRPVDVITETAKQIEETDLSRRITVETKDELGRLAATLNQMIARLESAFIRQKEFTSDASHELRAPLAVIQAESTLTLQKTRTTEEYRKSLEMIAQESEHMAAVINQLLTLARADSGKEHLRFDKIKLNDFVRDLCTDVDVVCQEKNLTLKQGKFDEVQVKGNTRSLRNLFHNLLDNAIRYTAKGGTISVMVRRESDMAVVSITDTGIGIPTDEQSLIFERFYRVDKARSRSEGSSGLGLAICRHILDVHGGDIELDSQVGKGSTFHVKLPVNIPV